MLRGCSLYIIAFEGTADFPCVVDQRDLDKIVLTSNAIVSRFVARDQIDSLPRPFTVRSIYSLRDCVGAVVQYARADMAELRMMSPIDISCNEFLEFLDRLKEYCIAETNGTIK